MKSSIFEAVLAALQTLLLEWTDREQLTLLGKPPAWAEQAFDCIDPGSSIAFEAAEFSPFLENFLFDAQALWQEQSPDLLRSGLWTETLDSEQSLRLEAVAMYLDGRCLLLIEQAEAIYDESFKWLQTARQENLKFISELKIATTQLVSARLYDTLTGLPNQVFFTAQLHQCFERHQPPAGLTSEPSQPRLMVDSFAVVMINVDRFQSLNDSLGREMGDYLLIAFADRIRQALRKEDIPARFGADEFGILLLGMSDSGLIQSTVQSITSSLNQSFSVAGHEVHMSASVGVAPYDDHYRHHRDLMRDASIAMHQAKALGRGQVVIFNRTMQARALELWSLERDLRRALKRQELQVYYQPLVAMGNHRVEGFEALVRWQHARKGWISPGEFVPMAEETGLILELDLWVLRQACMAIASWQASADYPLTVNVNLSSRHFRETKLVANVKQILAATHASPQNLKLELTESFLLDDTQAATQTLQHLRDLGIQVSIDDFGTGYASLGYLQDLAVDNLKIDGYFIETMADNNAEIVNTIINLSHNLDINVTAERIETREQYQQLHHLGCDYAQGYLISKPIPAERVPRFIGQRFNQFMQLDSAA